MPFDKRSSLSPAPGMMPGKPSRIQQQFLEAARTASGKEHERDLKIVKNFLADYVDTPITVAGVTYMVLARRGTTEGEAEASGTEPWQCEKLPDRVLRVYPSSVADGLGNYVWPTYNPGTGPITATPESRFDIQLPPGPVAPTSGWLWLECTIDDSNDYHGILTACELKVGAEPTGGFQGRSGATVNIAIAEWRLAFSGAMDYTLDPKRGFNFILRRYGPPGSFTWDVEAT